MWSASSRILDQVAGLLQLSVAFLCLDVENNNCMNSYSFTYLDSDRDRCHRLCAFDRRITDTRNFHQSCRTTDITDPWYRDVVRNTLANIHSMFNIPRLGLSVPLCVWMTSRRSQGRELNTPAELPLDTMTPQASRSRAAPSLQISKTHWVVLSFWITTQQYGFDMIIYLRNKQAHHQQPSLYSCQEEHHGTGLGEATC